MTMTMQHYKITVYGGLFIRTIKTLIRLSEWCLLDVHVADGVVMLGLKYICQKSIQLDIY